MVYDSIEFALQKDAEEFVNISNGPSRLISGQCFGSNNVYRTYESIREVNTRYDVELKMYRSLYSYKEYKKGHEVKDPYKIFMASSYPDNRGRYFGWIYFISILYGDHYVHLPQYEEGNPLYRKEDTLESLIEQFIDYTKKGILEVIKKEEDENQKKILKDTIVSVEETKYDVIGHRNTDNVIDDSIRQLEIRELYDIRNEAIQKELDRIDRYKNRLLSLIK